MDNNVPETLSSYKFIAPAFEDVRKSRDASEEDFAAY